MEEKIKIKLLLLLFSFILSSACIEESGKEKSIDDFILNPQKNISGYILIWHIYGKSALEELYKMHGFSEELKKLKNASIMVYHGKGNVAYIWLGVAENEISAKSMIAKMEEIISKNKTPYKISDKFKINNVYVVHAISRDGHHYFFYINRETIWIYLKREDKIFIESFIDTIKEYS